MKSGVYKIENLRDGRALADDSRAKLRAHRTGQKHTIATRKKIDNASRSAWTPERRTAQAERLRGKPSRNAGNSPSPEQRKAHSEFMTALWAKRKQESTDGV